MNYDEIYNKIKNQKINNKNKAKEIIDKEATLWMNNSTMKNNDSLISYFFINKSLSMSAGKTASQTARAGQVMLLNELLTDDSLLLDSLGQLYDQSFMRGNKTVTLKANEHQMNRILCGDLNDKLIELSKGNDVPIRLYPIYDIGMTEVITNSLTVIAMTPVKQSIITDFSKKFQLY